MAKTIKFNLILDNKPVRTIEDLQENFCIDDIAEFYENGLLQKWLKVRGYDDYLAKVEAISNKETAIQELVKIFEIEQSGDKIQEDLYSLKFWNERKARFEEFDKKDKEIRDIISDYHKGYDDIKEQLKEKKEDFAFIKSAVKEIRKNYLDLFLTDWATFFYVMKNESPLSLFAAMMDKGLRDYFDEDECSQLMSLTTNKKCYKSDTNTNWVKVTDKPAKILKIYDESRYAAVREAEGSEEFGETSRKVKKFNFEHGFEYRSNSSSDYVLYLEDCVGESAFKTFCNETEGYWKDLEENGKKVMVISIPKGTKIASPKDRTREYSEDEVNGKFLILDGLLYASNTDQDPIIYMEV